MSAARTLWDWADQREQQWTRDLRAVEKSLAYWETATDHPDRAHMLASRHHAREVMLAGGDCPIPKATLLTVLEAIAAIGAMIPRPVGPHRRSTLSPIEMVARFTGEDIRVSSAAIEASHARAADLEAMLHGALSAAGHPVTGMTSQQQWERDGFAPASAQALGGGDGGRG